jgi:hypothetical protein
MFSVERWGWLKSTQMLPFRNPVQTEERGLPALWGSAATSKRLIPTRVALSISAKGQPVAGLQALYIIKKSHTASRLYRVIEGNTCRRSLPAKLSAFLPRDASGDGM